MIVKSATIYETEVSMMNDVLVAADRVMYKAVDRKV
jgi:hypothetical protein